MDKINKLMKNKPLRDYVTNHLEGNPMNLEAIHIINISMAKNKAVDCDVKEYLQTLEEKAIELWRAIFNRRALQCPTCGR